MGLRIKAIVKIAQKQKVKICRVNQKLSIDKHKIKIKNILLIMITYKNKFNTSKINY